MINILKKLKAVEQKNEQMNLRTFVFGGSGQEQFWWAVFHPRGRKGGIRQFVARFAAEEAFRRTDDFTPRETEK